MSVQPYTFGAAAPDRVAELSRLLDDPQSGDVIEVRYEGGRWSADVVLECPRCKALADRGQWVEAASLPDLLRELVKAVRDRRALMLEQCPVEGHR